MRGKRNSVEALEAGMWTGVEYSTMRRFNAYQKVLVGLLVVWMCGCTKTTVTHYNGGPNPLDGGTSSDGGTLPPGFCNQAVEESLCEGASAPTGTGCPFSSLSVKPNTPKRSGVTFNFDCTLCPGGIPGIEGTYRLYEDDNLTQPNPSEYRETITFSGNHFVDVLEAMDPATNKTVKVTAKGYYFCPDPSAFQGKMKSVTYFNTVWVYTDVDPIGGFGIEPGATDPTFFGTGLSNNDIYLDANLYWDPNGSGQSSAQYCKVGSTLFKQECTNPFN